MTALELIRQLSRAKTDAPIFVELRIDGDDGSTISRFVEIDSIELSISTADMSRECATLVLNRPQGVYAIA